MQAAVGTHVRTQQQAGGRRRPASARTAARAALGSGAHRALAGGGRSCSGLAHHVYQPVSSPIKWGAVSCPDCPEN